MGGAQAPAGVCRAVLPKPQEELEEVGALDAPSWMVLCGSR